MATRSVEVYDQRGNLVESSTVEIPAEETHRTLSAQRAERALTDLRAYIALANPSAAQTTAVVKLLCRVAVTLIRLQLGRHEGTD